MSELNYGSKVALFHCIFGSYSIILHCDSMKKSKLKKQDKAVWDAFLKGKVSADYSHISQKHIESIWNDTHPLYHWRAISEMIYEVDTKVLEFILEMKVPINQLIRYELEIRKRDIEIQNKKFGI